MGAPDVGHARDVRGVPEDACARGSCTLLSPCHSLETSPSSEDDKNLSINETVPSRISLPELRRNNTPNNRNCEQKGRGADAAPVGAVEQEVEDPAGQDHRALAELHRALELQVVGDEVPRRAPLLLRRHHLGFLMRFNGVR